MSALHHVRVRRARGLPMPPPPKPKRPLGPPTLFIWKDVSIRVRADIQRAGWTWDGFLDELVAFRMSNPVLLKRPVAPEDLQAHQVLRLLKRLVPPEDLQAHREDVTRRVREAREANEKAHAEIKSAWDAKFAEKKGHLGAVIDHLFRRSA